MATYTNGVVSPNPGAFIPESGAAAWDIVAASADAQLGNRYTKAQADALLAGKASSSHTHPVSQVTGLQAALDAKVGSTDPRLSDARTPLPHGHQVSDVEGLESALDAAGGSASWAQVTDKPTTFPPSPHHHPVSDVTELQAALDSKAAKEPVDLASQDLDTVLDDGPYTQPSSSTASPSLNYPVNASGAAQAGHLRVQSRPGNYLVLQEYTTFDGGAKFWRTRYAGTWNPWYLVVDSSDPRLIGETGWDDAIAALNAAAA